MTSVTCVSPICFEKTKKLLCIILVGTKLYLASLQKIK